MLAAKDTADALVEIAVHDVVVRLLSGSWGAIVPVGLPLRVRLGLALVGLAASSAEVVCLAASSCRRALCVPRLRAIC